MASLCNDFLTYLLTRLIGSLCLHSCLALDLQAGELSTPLYNSIQKMHKGKRLHPDSIWFYFFRVHSGTILLLGPIPEVSLFKAEKYVHKLITELYPAFHSVQLAFAGGSTGGALCISQCMERVFETTVFFSITC